MHISRNISKTQAKQNDADRQKAEDKCCAEEIHCRCLSVLNHYLFSYLQPMFPYRQEQK